MKMKLLVFTILACLATCILTVDPPVWAQTFTQQFIQGDSSVKKYTTGKLWYDYKNNRQRVDYKSDVYDPVCESIGMDPQTPCSQINVNNALYISLPEKNLCCKCCTSAQGCVIEPPSWLSTFKYMGDADLSGQTFNKWSQSGQNYYDTKDSARMPRRVQQGTFGLDFIMSSYTTNAIDNSVFALPSSSCNTDCPKASMCGSGLEKAQSANWFKLFSKKQNKNMKITEQ